MYDCSDHDGDDGGSGGGESFCFATRLPKTFAMRLKPSGPRKRVDHV